MLLWLIKQKCVLYKCLRLMFVSIENMCVLYEHLAPRLWFVIASLRTYVCCKCLCCINASVFVYMSSKNCVYKRFSFGLQLCFPKYVRT